jgi:hypothetical protein
VEAAAKPKGAAEEGESEEQQEAKHLGLCGVPFLADPGTVVTPRKGATEGQLGRARRELWGSQSHVGEKLSMRALLQLEP